ncbi:glycosyltransferase family 2 protein [Polaribacter sp.]|uniref:glycosyltransferase family 2 protein n=1 Tax=Polaribacter sp. TaxID=1920175 RepID=UPI003F6C768C
MLSVLIPTYNFNAFFLVKALHQQLILENIKFEIICLDDGSKSTLNTENEKINTFTFTTFSALNKNIGRSAIRNLLAKKANYSWLLFLDADVMPADSNFIENYIKCFQQKNTIFCGGLLYENKKENVHLLRYKFGKKHEEVSVEKRNKQPEKYFFTSNFLIEKNVFNHISFEEKLTQYGREDLMFSLSLIKKGYKIEHLANEVYHLGLDADLIFVEKTKKAIENLFFLNERKLIDKGDLKLLKLTDKISALKLCNIVAKTHSFFEKQTLQKKSVFYLNCLKVAYLCFLKERQNNI